MKNDYIPGSLSSAKVAPIELSLILPAYNEKKNLAALVPELKRILPNCTKSFEIIVVDAGSEDDSASLARELGVIVFAQKQKKFAAAIKEGIEAARGEYIMTMDADNSHRPELVVRLIEAVKDADMVIASRYIAGATFHTNIFRKIGSRLLNKIFKNILSLHVSDLSSGFRIYRREALQDIQIESQNFDVQLEILIKIIAHGWLVKEIPMAYKNRLFGRSKASWISCVAFFKTCAKMYKLRNSMLSGDYDDRACGSRLLPQRLWHKYKDRTTFEYAVKEAFSLDAGCGSGSFIRNFSNTVGLDADINKVRYLKRAKGLNNRIMLGTITSMPFENETFEQIMCSEVIEHVPKSDKIFKEFRRVLKPGGRLVLTTPDYGRPIWPFFEWIYRKAIPHGYAAQHISHYGDDELRQLLNDNNFEIIERKSFLGAIIIIKAEKRICVK